MNAIVNNLNGYLYALRRMTQNTCDFWAELITLDDELEAALRQHLAQHEPQFAILSIEQVNYEKVEQLLKQYIYDRLMITDEALVKSFDWDVVEFFGLAATMKSETSSHNPLVSDDVTLLTIQSDAHEEQIYLVVPMGDQAILMGLGLRKSESA